MVGNSPALWMKELVVATKIRALPGNRQSKSEARQPFLALRAPVGGAGTRRSIIR